MRSSDSGAENRVADARDRNHSLRENMNEYTAKKVAIAHNFIHHCIWLIIPEMGSFRIDISRNLSARRHWAKKKGAQKSLNRK